MIAWKTNQWSSSARPQILELPSESRSNRWGRIAQLCLLTSLWFRDSSTLGARQAQRLSLSGEQDLTFRSIELISKIKWRTLLSRNVSKWNGVKCRSRTSTSCRPSELIRTSSRRSSTRSLWRSRRMKKKRVLPNEQRCCEISRSWNVFLTTQLEKFRRFSPTESHDCLTPLREATRSRA